MTTKSHSNAGLLLLKTLTVLAVLIYIPAVTGWYVSHLLWWPLALASLIFVFQWLLILILAVIWFFRSRIVALLLLVLLFCGTGPARASISVGKSSTFPVEKVPQQLRVMQWNCEGLPGFDKTMISRKEERKAAERFIGQYRPDIICLQDFSEIRDPRMNSNIGFLHDSLGYLHHVIGTHATSLQRYGWITQGTAIFSKLPPIRQGVMPFTHQAFSENIVWADFLFQGREIRVVTTHFTSMQLFSHRTFNGKKLPYYMQPDSAIIMSPDMMKKLRYFQAGHARQAAQLRAFLDTCRVPVILAADLNTVPANYIYRQVRGDLADGFIGSKTGMGNTFNYLAPHLRIDYLLHHRQLEATHWKHFSDGFFDHDHLVADYRWKPRKAK